LIRWQAATKIRAGRVADSLIAFAVPGGGFFNSLDPELTFD
jgi:hypothetical protein